MSAAERPFDLVLFDLDGTLIDSAPQLALAVNRNVVPRKAWPGKTLQSQDQVEIVRAIGGG